MSKQGLDQKDLERRMKGALDVLLHEFSGLRTGRASANLLEHVQVEAYGSSLPMAVFLRSHAVGVPFHTPHTRNDPSSGGLSR